MVNSIKVNINLYGSTVCNLEIPRSNLFEMLGNFFDGCGELETGTEVSGFASEVENLQFCNDYYFHVGPYLVTRV